VSISREKFTRKEKIAILRCIEEGESLTAVRIRFGVGKETIRTWRRKVEVQGNDALARKPKNRCYPETLKRLAVEAFLSGEGSQQEIALQYGLRSKTQLQVWIMKYTRGEILKSSRGGEVRAMSKGRKTSYEERLETVRYCEAHDNNYQKAAKVYQVSYSQVYSWVKKYDEGGENALLDRRGKAKDEAALTELDRLKLENRKLLRKNRELEVENAVLKKLEELERRSR
jgi:transposase